jgi:hypothetical protein
MMKRWMTKMLQKRKKLKGQRVRVAVRTLMIGVKAATVVNSRKSQAIALQVLKNFKTLAENWMILVIRIHRRKVRRERRRKKRRKRKRKSRKSIKIEFCNNINSVLAKLRSN